MPISFLLTLNSTFFGDDSLLEFLLAFIIEEQIDKLIMECSSLFIYGLSGYMVSNKLFLLSKEKVLSLENIDRIIDSFIAINFYLINETIYII